MRSFRGDVFVGEFDNSYELIFVFGINVLFEELRDVFFEGCIFKCGMRYEYIL